MTNDSAAPGLLQTRPPLDHTAPSPDTVRLHEGAIYFGMALVLLAAMSTVLAAISHWRTLQQLRRGRTPNMSQWPLTITIAFLTALLFIAGLWVVFPRDIT